jgi:hypothetical protein
MAPLSGRAPLGFEPHLERARASAVEYLVFDPASTTEHRAPIGRGAGAVLVRGASTAPGARSGAVGRGGAVVTRSPPR